jgi:hypothetical protein
MEIVWEVPSSMLILFLKLGELLFKLTAGSFKLNKNYYFDTYKIINMITTYLT